MEPRRRLRIRRRRQLRAVVRSPRKPLSAKAYLTLEGFTGRSAQVIRQVTGLKGSRGPGLESTQGESRVTIQLLCTTFHEWRRAPRQRGRGGLEIWISARVTIRFAETSRSCSRRLQALVQALGQADLGAHSWLFDQPRTGHRTRLGGTCMNMVDGDNKNRHVGAPAFSLQCGSGAGIP